MSLLPVQFPGAHGAARRRAGVGAALPRTAGGLPAPAGTGRSHPLPHRQLEVFLPQLVQVGATSSLTGHGQTKDYSRTNVLFSSIKQSKEDFIQELFVLLPSYTLVIQQLVPTESFDWTTGLP